MRTFYPAIKPYRTHRVKVTDLHTLYVEEVGDERGIPVLFVHGGPGAGFTENDRRFFDPEKYRIILFDQRGAGRSKPHAELTDNHTPALIADIERIRQHLAVDKWVLFGGSWGSTLSLLYAQTYPERVMGLVLRGIFLCRDEDIRWFYQEGANAVFPDYWQDFVEQIPQQEREDLVQAYYRRLTSGNELQRMAAAKAWSIWEARCATLQPNPDLVEHLGDPHVALAMARIEAHYFVRQAFIRPNQIIDDAGKLADIPGYIVHGRYDMVCPVKQAYDLHRAWPQAKLEIIRDAGHASSQPGIVDALVGATAQLARELGY